MKDKPKVGQKLYSLNVGNAVSKWCPQELTEVEVKKVGTKYFYCGKPGFDGGRETQYYLDIWKEKGAYSPTSRLYETAKEWEEEVEARTISRVITDAFKYGRNRRGLSIEKLRRIADILGEE